MAMPMPSDTRPENVPDRADTTPPRAWRKAAMSSSLVFAPLPASTPCDASHAFSVSSPFVSSAAIWPDCWPTPARTSQIEPTTTAVSPSSTRRAPPERGTPRAWSRSTSGAKSAPSTAARTRGTTKPDTCDSSHSTAAANASTPTSSHDRVPHRTRPGDAATDQPALRGSRTATHLLHGAADGHP